MIGTVLSDRYELLGLGGEGGMAVTYRARDLQLNREVAVKLLREQYVHDQAFVERFRREAQAAASLSHPNIAAVYDLGKHGDVPFIVMEFVDGPDLAQVLKQQGPLLIDAALGLTQQVAEALKHAHAQGVVHRDIKPGNLLLAPEGGGSPGATETRAVKVADFGIAQARALERMTGDQSLVGTAHYLSPEQAQGAEVGPGSDLYSLGIVLYQMLTGRVPFEAESPVAVAVMHLNERPEPPSRWRGEVPFGLDRIVLRLLAKTPDQRPASAQELLDELRALATVPPSVPPPQESALFDPDRTQLIPGGAILAMPAPASVPAAVVPTRPPAVLAPAPRPATSTGTSAWMIGGLLVLLAIVLGLGLGMILKQNPLNARVELPDLSRLSLIDAQKQITELGLKVGLIRYEPHDEIPADHVIRQLPAAGAMIPASRDVNLVISKGKEERLTEVPDVTQVLKDKAVRQLEESGLRVSAITEEASDTVPAGIVISQSPEGGTRISEGARVSLVISKGPAKPVIDERPVAGVIEYQVPDEPAEQQIRIVVIDVTGERTLFDKTVPAKEKIREPVTGKGRTEVRIFNGDTIVESKVLEPQ